MYARLSLPYLVIGDANHSVMSCLVLLTEQVVPVTDIMGNTAIVLPVRVL